MQEVLNEKITLVSVNISTFSGYRRATREHIASLGGILPNCAAITEGSIKVFPCDGTKALQTVRRTVFRKLQAQGIRALGSQNVFAVLTDELPDIEKEIAAAQVDFASEMATLDSQYDNIFEAHVAANAEAETIIRSLKVDRNDAIARCRFSTNVFRISPFVREGESEVESVEGIVRGLGRQLYEEISSEMEKLSRNESIRRQKVGQKTLRPIKAAVAKMIKLSFLDSSVEGAISLVTQTLKDLPSEGYIQGQDYLRLVRLIYVMSDADELLNAASKVKNGVLPGDALFPPLVVQDIDAVTESDGGPATDEEASDVRELVTEPVVVPPVSSLPHHPVSGIKANTTRTLVPARLPSLPGQAPAVPGLKPSAALKSNALMF